MEVLVDDGCFGARTIPPSVTDRVDELLARAASGELRGVLSSTSALALSGLRHRAPVLSTGFEGPVDPVSTARIALTTALDEVTRSIDTIKHQAKTVTVGTSRGDADLLDNVLVAALRSAGTDITALGFLALDILRSFAGIVAATGVTHYAVDWDAPAERRLRVTTKHGCAATLSSRADAGGPLTGQKRLAVEQQLPVLTRGHADGRTVVIVPELVAGTPRGIGLVHVDLLAAAPPERVRRAVEAAGTRAAEIVAAVTELSPRFPLDEVWELPPEVAVLAPVENVVRALRRD
jgi:glucosamine--fructose-6-phosphate aminotransferase (isomerizing)